MDLTMIMIMTFVYVLVLGMDFVPVYRGKNPKLIWLYLALFLGSYALTLLIAFGVKVPSPAPAIKTIVSLFVKIK